MSGPEALHRFKAGDLQVKVYADAQSASEAAAMDAARALTRLGESGDEFGVIFATGASQIGTRRFCVATRMPRFIWIGKLPRMLACFEPQFARG